MQIQEFFTNSRRKSWPTKEYWKIEHNKHIPQSDFSLWFTKGLNFFSHNFLITDLEIFAADLEVYTIKISSFTLVWRVCGKGILMIVILWTKIIRLNIDCTSSNNSILLLFSLMLNNTIKKRNTKNIESSPP